MYYSNTPSLQCSNLKYVGARQLSATMHMSLFSSNLLVEFLSAQAQIADLSL